MNQDFNGYTPPFMDNNNNFDMNDLYKDPMFNPIMQYEQAYSYYKYLCMQIDYKIKCKEYEKLCASTEREQKRTLITIVSVYNILSTRLCSIAKFALANLCTTY